MTQKFSKSLSNVMVIDLLNASKEDIRNHCLFSGAANGLKLYLEHLHNNLHNDLFSNANPHKVFFDSDYIIGTIRNDQNVEQFSLGGLEILPEFKNNESSSFIFEKNENQMFLNKSVELNKETKSSLELCFSNLVLSNSYNKDFVQMHIEVKKNLAVSFPIFCKEYNQNIVFVDCANQPDLDSLILNKIFYRFEQPIIFTFKNNSGLEYLGWSKDFLIQLNQIKPIQFKQVSKISKLNAVLDKINSIGLPNLDEEEIAFLNEFSKQA